MSTMTREFTQTQLIAVEPECADKGETHARP